MLNAEHFWLTQKVYHEGAVLHFQGAPGARAVIDFVYGHALISCHALVVKVTIRLWNTIRSSS